MRLLSTLLLLRTAMSKLIYPLLTLFIPRLAAWLTGLTAADFDRVRHWVERAEHYPAEESSREKGERVRELIRLHWPALQTWAVNILLELAVAWLRRR